MKIFKYIVLFFFTLAFSVRTENALFVPTYSLAGTASTGTEQTIFAHGLGGNYRQAGHYHATAGDHNHIITGSVTTFDFDDAKDTSLTCLGQTADIEKMITVTEQVITQGTKVLKPFGVSRGGATCINSAACKRFKDLIRNNGVKVVMVAESPFHHAKAAGAKAIGNVLPESWVNGLMPVFAFKNYNPCGQQPILAVNNFPKDIPLLLVCSQEDGLVPVYSTVCLYNKFRQLGYKKVHLLVLEKGQHANILWGRDGHIYRNVVHAFYRHYGVEYNQEWADAGQAYFANTQPGMRKK